MRANTDNDDYTSDMNSDEFDPSECEQIAFDRERILLHTIFIFPVALFTAFVSFVGTLLMADIGMIPSGYTLSLCTYSGLLHITYLFKLGRKPGIVLTDGYIHDNSCIASSGRIPWSEVFGAEPIDGLVHKGIALFVYDRDALYLRHRFPRRWLLKANEHLFGSPVHVSTDCLQISRGKLLVKIRSHLQSHRALASPAPPTPDSIGRFGNYAPREEYLVPYLEQSPKRNPQQP